MTLVDNGRLWRREGVRGGEVCFDGTGLQIEHVFSRFVAGDTLADLAKDYHLSMRDLEAGLRAIVGGAFTSRGLRADVVRKMESHIPLLRNTLRAARAPHGAP